MLYQREKPSILTYQTVSFTIRGTVVRRVPNTQWRTVTCAMIAVIGRCHFVDILIGKANFLSRHRGMRSRPEYLDSCPVAYVEICHLPVLSCDV